MTLSKDLWLNNLQIRKKMYPPMMPIVCLGKESTISDVFLSSRELSLSSVSGQKDCLTSLRCLSSLRSARQPLRSVRHLVLLPYDLGKWKFSLGNKNSSSFVFLPWTHVWHHGGIYIHLSFLFIVFSALWLFEWVPLWMCNLEFYYDGFIKYLQYSY